MSNDDLMNPMVFSVRPRTIDIDKYLNSDGLRNKRVTEIEITPGQMRVHWSECDG